jgi:hypothetical protein
MPEIDTELFQTIVLGGLALILLILLLTINSVGKLKKSIQEGIKSAPAEVHPAQNPLAAAEPQPVAASYDEPWGSSQQPVQQQAQTFEMPVAATPAPAAAVQSIPEEQPFEKDGRWWFKRGDELLVYDEQTGQWQPAPANNPFSSGGAPSGMQPAAAMGGAQPSGESGGFWKCTSCGAVNGSTSATCRMCFAARP